MFLKKNETVCHCVQVMEGLEERINYKKSKVKRENENWKQQNEKEMKKEKGKVGGPRTEFLSPNSEKQLCVSPCLPTLNRCSTSFLWPSYATFLLWKTLSTIIKAGEGKEECFLKKHEDEFRSPAVM